MGNACVGTSPRRRVAPIRLKCTRGRINAARIRPTRNGDKQKSPESPPGRRYRPSFDPQYHPPSRVPINNPTSSPLYTHSTLHRIVPSLPISSAQPFFSGVNGAPVFGAYLLNAFCMYSCSCYSSIATSIHSTIGSSLTRTRQVLITATTSISTPIFLLPALIVLALIMNNF